MPGSRIRALMSTHPPSPSPSAGRVFLWRLALALVLTSTAAAVGLGGGSVLLQHKFAQAKSVKVDLDGALPGSMNILLLGSDSRAFVEDSEDKGSFGDTRAVGGQRADVIIMARIEPKARRAILVSIPRDTYVRLPKYKGQVLINQSFEDGPQGVINAIKSNFGVPINHYAEIDFDGFRKMVDAIGGVRMYVPAPSRDHPGDPNNHGTGLDIKTAGCQTFDGKTALAWVRSRYFQYYEAGKWRSDPTSDLGRISRQQDFIRRLMAQAIEKGAFNPIKANRLADAAMANLTVDSTFNVKDGLRMVQAFRPVGPAGVEMVALPTKPSGVHLAVSSEAQPILARLRGEAGPAATGEASGAKGPKVAPSDVKVRVLNGTGVAGAAGVASADLGAAGFSPAGSGDADNFGYTRTQIRYASGAQPKAAFLARYLGGAGQLVADNTLRGTDIVLVVGGDWKGVTPPAGAGSGQSAASTSPTTAAPTTTTAKGSASSTAPAPAGGPAQPAC
jgi:LCP family protein required for cell wall assembly